jgi:hypothetical protein
MLRKSHKTAKNLITYVIVDFSTQFSKIKGIATFHKIWNWKL